jgi:hypothetical protein
VIPNEKLLAIVERRTSILDAFRLADDVLRQGVQGITDLITIPGLINLDFADVRTIMTDAGSALMGIGMGQGENRAAEAAKTAISSPLLEESVEGATGILLNITGGRDLGLFEVNEAAEIVSSASSTDSNIIFGAVVDDSMGEDVRVTVIATGFDRGRAAAAGAACGPSATGPAARSHQPARPLAADQRPPARVARDLRRRHRHPAVPAGPLARTGRRTERIPTCGDCAQPPGSGSVRTIVQKPQITADELAEHLRLVDVASRDDMDELLTDLLCHVYRTKDSQNG